MKQLKQADPRAQQSGSAAGATAKDSRQLKPPAGQQSRHRFPLPGDALAAPAKPGTAVNAARPAGDSDGQRLKPGAPAADESAGEEANPKS